LYVTPSVTFQPIIYLCNDFIIFLIIGHSSACVFFLTALFLELMKVKIVL
jgi:hypothetical protein